MQRQLDRPLRGRGGRLPRSRGATSTFPSSRRGRTRCSAPPSSCSRPSTRCSSELVAARRRGGGTRSVRYVAKTGALERSRTRSRDREGRRLHRPLRRQPGQRRADADLGRRLRADGLRHRRDHGRARRTTSATSSSRSGTTCPVRTVVVPAGERGAGRRGAFSAHTATSSSSTRASSPASRAPRRRRAIVAWLEEHGRRQRDGELPAARLGLLAAALLGLPDPDRLLRRRAGSCPCRTRTCRCVLPGGRGLRAARQGAARLARGVDERRLPEVRRAGACARPTRWTPSSTRPGTSCATATRTTTRRRSTVRSSTTGARSTTTPAASTTRRCT